MAPHIVLLGTCDTKLQELLFFREQILAAGGKVTFVDVGRSTTQHEHINISHNTLTTEYAPEHDLVEDIGSLPRGEVIKYMITCASNCIRDLYRDESNPIHGICNAGGTGNTSLSAAVMRNELPIGLPKLVVSTAASGDISPYVVESDITMMYSVCDISGLNYLLRRILTNAAGAIAGMATAYQNSMSITPSSSPSSDKPRVGLTMFGVTTPCVDAIRTHLASTYGIESLVFHCTGAGGRAMERLVREGVLSAVLDVTTTEIADHLVGGVMSAGPGRLDAALERGIPYVVSVGATDMVNFGPKATVPERFQARKLYEHNPTVTLMRTSVDECRQIGDFIVEKIKTKAKDPAKVKVVLPTGGVSMIAGKDGAFYDGDADEAIFHTIVSGLQGTGVQVIEDERGINDSEFAVEVLAKTLISLMGLKS